MKEQDLKKLIDKVYSPSLASICDDSLFQIFKFKEKIVYCHCLYGTVGKLEEIRGKYTRDIYNLLSSSKSLEEKKKEYITIEAHYLEMFDNSVDVLKLLYESNHYINQLFCIFGDGEYDRDKNPIMTYSYDVSDEDMKKVQFSIHEVSSNIGKLIKMGEYVDKCTLMKLIFDYNVAVFMRDIMVANRNKNMKVCDNRITNHIKPFSINNYSVSPEVFNLIRHCFYVELDLHSILPKDKYSSEVSASCKTDYQIRNYLSEYYSSDFIKKVGYDNSNMYNYIQGELWKKCVDSYKDYTHLLLPNSNVSLRKKFYDELMMGNRAFISILSSEEFCRLIENFVNADGLIENENIRMASIVRENKDKCLKMLKSNYPLISIKNRVQNIQRMLQIYVGEYNEDLLEICIIYCVDNRTNNNSFISTYLLKHSVKTMKKLDYFMSLGKTYPTIWLSQEYRKLDKTDHNSCFKFIYENLIHYNIKCDELIESISRYLKETKAPIIDINEMENKVGEESDESLHLQKRW